MWTVRIVGRGARTGSPHGSRDDADTCHARLVRATKKIDEYLVACRRGRLLMERPLAPFRQSRSEGDSPEIVLPAVRGALGKRERVILNYDDRDDVLQTLAAERTPELVRRGMATPEHLLRAGRLPVWLDSTSRRRRIGSARRCMPTSRPHARRTSPIMDATPPRGEGPR